jgi:CRISPR-associated endonuclease Csn1
LNRWQAGTMLRTMRYRLALDIGAKSIGWALLRLAKDENKPVAVIKLGVRIFPDGRNPKDGSSLAVTRRQARQMRRRRDRLVRRKERLLQALIDFGFLPQDAEARHTLVNIDPYALRKKGLDQALKAEEFGRALFHINQRRGFKSNRKTDKKDNDSGALKSAIKRVREHMTTTGFRTVGEWLASRHEQRASVRARLRGQTIKDKAYDLYIDRAMIEHEFDQLWACQTMHNPALFNDAARSKLKDILLYQRPLKTVIPGRCSLMPEEYRAPLALPSVQRFRIYQEVNNLRILDTGLQENALTLVQRDQIALSLDRTGDLTFTAIRRLLKLPGTTKFNLEDSKRDRLKGNATSKILAKEGLFGPQWHGYSDAEQDVLVNQLLTNDSEEKLVTELMTTYQLNEPAAEAVCNASLPEGYGNLSSKALGRILPELKAAVITYAAAVVAAGFDSHSELSNAEQTGEVMQEVPYYGEALQRHVGFGSGAPEDPPENRFGRIANPTVHIGLNQVRRVVNALIRHYGHPSEVVVEVARELKQGKALRDEIQKQQTARQAENDDYRKKIATLLSGGVPSAQDVQRMRLWVELNREDVTNRCCPYTGQHISMAMLFSDAVEVEHILPFSKTLDDSMNNKTVALRSANRDKSNKIPYEAFGHSPSGYDYAAIVQRAALMPKEKAKRFAEDGYERWLKEDKDFLARALNDTAYLSRIAKEYLTLICPHNKVWVIPGRLTAMLRGKFGLNQLLSGTQEKNRNDHRHHAIDAAVIGITDRALLESVARANQSTRERGLHRLIDDMPLPWPSFQDHVRRAVQHIIVSFRPDHGYQGGLHNDTAHGLGEGGLVTHRKPLSKFDSVDAIAKAEFADARLKDWLLSQFGEASEVSDKKEAKKAFLNKLANIASTHRLHRVKVLEKLSVIPIASGGNGRRHGIDEAGNPAAYKGYKGDSNYCIEIYRDKNGVWRSDVISTFQAYQVVRKQGEATLRNQVLAMNGQSLVMRLMIDDVIRLSLNGKVETLRVATISGNGQVFMAPLNEANCDARNRDTESSFGYISKKAGSFFSANARKVTVSEIGVLHDPGFKA